eukprot:509432-Lingulodinium_polyedra.AAC.1
MSPASCGQSEGRGQPCRRQTAGRLGGHGVPQDVEEEISPGVDRPGASLGDRNVVEPWDGEP